MISHTSGWASTWTKACRIGLSMLPPEPSPRKRNAQIPSEDLIGQGHEHADNREPGPPRDAEEREEKGQQEGRGDDVAHHLGQQQIKENCPQHPDDSLQTGLSVWLSLRRWTNETSSHQKGHYDEKPQGSEHTGKEHGTVPLRAYLLEGLAIENLTVGLIFLLERSPKGLGPLCGIPEPGLL